MSVEALLYTKLSNNAGVAALVSNRIYPTVLPEGASLSAVTYQVISSPRNITMSGDNGFRNPRIQVTAWATTAKAAEAVAAALEAALAGWKDANSSPPIQNAFVDDEVVLYDPAHLPVRHGRALDIFVQYEV